MEPDPLREIRDIRRQISEECGNNPERVFAYYLAHQQKMKDSGVYTFATQPVVHESSQIATEPSVERKSPS